LSGRYEHGQGHPSHRRVDTRLEHSKPEGHAQDQVGKFAALATGIEDSQNQDGSPGPQQPDDLQVLSEEQTNDKHSPEVVGDRQCRQKNPDRCGQPSPQQGNGPQDKGYISGHGYTPTINCGTAEIEEDIDQGRYNHPTEGRRHRKDGPPH